MGIARLGVVWTLNSAREKHMTAFEAWPGDLSGPVMNMNSSLDFSR